jgi:hypothetical protein
MRPEPAPKRNRAWQRYLLAVGLALFVGLVWYFGWQRIRDALLLARPLPLLGMVALLIAGFWIRVAKWRYALGPHAHAPAIFFVSKVGGNLTPGRVGELSPLLMRRFRTPRLAAWLVTDRVLEMGLTLALGLVGVAVLRLLPMGVVAALAGAGLLLSGGAWWLVYRRDLTRGLNARFPGASRLHRLARLPGLLHAETRALGARMPVIVAVTLLAKCIDIWAAQLLLLGFGHDTGFLLMAAARCAHGLVSAMPLTPDATGVPFVAAAMVLNQAAGIPYEVLTVALALEVAVINLLLWTNMALTAGSLRKYDANDPAQS